MTSIDQSKSRCTDQSELTPGTRLGIRRPSSCLFILTSRPFTFSHPAFSHVAIFASICSSLLSIESIFVAVPTTCTHRCDRGAQLARYELCKHRNIAFSASTMPVSDQLWELLLSSTEALLVISNHPASNSYSHSTTSYPDWIQVQVN